MVDQNDLTKLKKLQSEMYDINQKYKTNGMITLKDQNTRNGFSRNKIQTDQTSKLSVNIIQTKPFKINFKPILTEIQDKVCNMKTETNELKSEINKKMKNKNQLKDNSIHQIVPENKTNIKKSSISLSKTIIVIPDKYKTMTSNKWKFDCQQGFSKERKITTFK